MRVLKTTFRLEVRYWVTLERKDNNRSSNNQKIVYSFFGLFM